jgi:hypothetical protein
VDTAVVTRAGVPADPAASGRARAPERGVDSRMLVAPAVVVAADVGLRAWRLGFNGLTYDERFASDSFEPTSFQGYRGCLPMSDHATEVWADGVNHIVCLERARS